MTLKDEIKNAANEYVSNVKNVEIATLKLLL